MVKRARQALHRFIFRREVGYQGPMGRSCRPHNKLSGFTTVKRRPRCYCDPGITLHNLMELFPSSFLL